MADHSFVVGVKKKLSALVNLLATLVILPTIITPGLAKSALTHEQLPTSKGVDELTIIEAPASNQQTFDRLGKLLQDNPQNARAHLLLAACYEAQGLGRLAADEYQLADKYSLQDPPVLLAQFQRRIAHKDMCGARQLLVLAKQKFPQDGHTLLMQALFDACSNQSLQAESVLQKLVDSPVAPPGVASILAALQLKQANYAAAIALSNRDLQRGGDSYLANAVKGVALLKLGQFQAARAPLAQAFAISPTQKGIAQDLCQVLLKVATPTDSLKAALVSLVVAADPTDLESARRTVSRLLQMLPPDTVEQISRQTSKLLGSTDYTLRLHFLLGCLYKESGQHQRAIHQFQQGLLLDPYYAAGYFQLAGEERAAGNYRMAWHNYLVASMLAPDNELYALTWGRFSQQLLHRQNDIAWQLKDWLWGLGATGH